MPRFLAAILLVAVLALGGGLIANAAYQAGVNTAVTTATASGAPVVAPVVRRALRLPVRLARLRLRLGDLRAVRRPVLPVHRVRPDPRHLLARRPGPHAAAGADRGWDRPRRLTLADPSS